MSKQKYTAVSGFYWDNELYQYGDPVEIEDNYSLQRLLKNGKVIVGTLPKATRTKNTSEQPLTTREGK